MRRFLIPALAVLVAAGVATGFAIAHKPRTNTTHFDYAIGLWGDLPYSAVQENPGIPNLIADMRRCRTPSHPRGSSSSGRCARTTNGIRRSTPTTTATAA